MNMATASDVLASSAAPISPNLAAWVIVFISTYVGASIAERIPKVRDVQWLRYMALGLGSVVGAVISWWVVDYAFDVGSATTAAPDWLGLVTAFVVTAFLTSFVNQGIAELIPRSAGTWQRRIVWLLVAVVAAVIVWYLAYYVFNVELPGQ